MPSKRNSVKQTRGMHNEGVHTENPAGGTVRINPVLSPEKEVFSLRINVGSLQKRLHKYKGVLKNMDNLLARSRKQISDDSYFKHIVRLHYPEIYWRCVETLDRRGKKKNGK
jgi:hypothetical protein